MSTEQQPGAPAVPGVTAEEEILAHMTAMAEAAKAVPSRWTRDDFEGEVEAMQFTYASGPQVWEWADSKPTYGTDKFVDGLAVYTRAGRVRAAFGDWVVRDPGGAFTVWTDGAFRGWHEPAGETGDPGVTPSPVAAALDRAERAEAKLAAIEACAPAIADALRYALSYVEHVPNPNSQAAAERYRSALAVIGTGGETPPAPAKSVAARVTVSLACGHEGWIYSDEGGVKFAWCGACGRLRTFTLACTVSTEGDAGHAP